MNFKERDTWLKIASCKSISAKKRAVIWQKVSTFGCFEMSIEQIVNIFFSSDKKEQINMELEEADVYTTEEAEIICILDDNYPDLLKEIYEAPPLLFCKGNTALLKKQAMAMVGTRRISEYGRKACAMIAGELAELKLTIVSGLALGIDAEAHKASLRKKGDTIAVLGSGVSNIYPRSNEFLANEIIEHGLLISEYLPNQEDGTFQNAIGLLVD